MKVLIKHSRLSAAFSCYDIFNNQTDTQFLGVHANCREDSVLPGGPSALPRLPLLVFSSMVSFQESSKTKICFVGLNLVKITSYNLLSPLK